MRGKVEIAPFTYILLPAALLLLPLRWVLAWVLAVSIHETGHYLALRLCKVPVYGLRLSPLGVTMQVGDLQGRETVLCALAGPLFALMFTVLSPIMPCTAVCIFFQSLFNLLPVYPLDGGRALRVILCKWLPLGAVKGAELLLLSIKAVFCFLLFYKLRLGLGVSLLLLLIFTQKLLANRGNTGYNKGDKQF